MKKTIFVILVVGLAFGIQEYQSFIAGGESGGPSQDVTAETSANWHSGDQVRGSGSTLNCPGRGTVINSHWSSH